MRFFLPYAFLFCLSFLVYRLLVVQILSSVARSSVLSLSMFINQTSQLFFKLETESSPNRSSYNGPTHGYAHTYNGDTITKSPSPSFHYRSTPKRDSGHTKHRREDHPHTVVTTRSRSPPVVTIAPTLSLSNLQYQDSRKVRICN